MWIRGRVDAKRRREGRAAFSESLGLVNPGLRAVSVGMQKMCVEGSLCVDHQNGIPRRQDTGILS